MQAGREKVRQTDRHRLADSETDRDRQTDRQTYRGVYVTYVPRNVKFLWNSCQMFFSQPLELETVCVCVCVCVSVCVSVCV